ncbi:magnesium protoporphyrin IX methyltransferase [Ideonella sp. DXS29W]|uniref:Magnesium protoporphyrin IX methyltransferase n=1 Tax=Ideonella lacteola TaxID=2984193 RepID=A0ABU9BQB1_9BURK
MNHWSYTGSSAAPPQAGISTPEGRAAYVQRRGEIEHYFDRTAAQAWARLTSNAPLGRIRASVRAGRDEMRATLLGWLPADLHGARVLDAGCGTGAMAVEAARRGAEVVAIDLSPTLVKLAAERLPRHLPGRVTFLAGDMLDPALGRFDHIVAMDSLIHYEAADAVQALERLAGRGAASIVFTHVPSTPLLVAMRAVGRLFPRGNRAPSVVPVSTPVLHHRLADAPVLAGWRPARQRRVSTGFYTSQAMELVAP